MSLWINDKFSENVTFKQSDESYNSECIRIGEYSPATLTNGALQMFNVSPPRAKLLFCTFSAIYSLASPTGGAAGRSVPAIRVNCLQIFHSAFYLDAVTLNAAKWILKHNFRFIHHYVTRRAPHSITAMNILISHINIQNYKWIRRQINSSVLFVWQTVR